MHFGYQQAVNLLYVCRARRSDVARIAFIAGRVSSFRRAQHARISELVGESPCFEIETVQTPPRALFRW
jgi:hypothetical protein